MNRREQKEAESIIRLVSGSTFDTVDLQWHVKGVEHCKRLLEYSKDEALAMESLGEKVTKL